MNNLKDAKVGDRVLCFSYSAESIKVITRTTPTMVYTSFTNHLGHTHETGWMRRTGYPRGGGSYGRVHIRPLQEGDEERWEMRRRIVAQKKALSEFANVTVTEKNIAFFEELNLAGRLAELNKRES